jgi:hypothetical protein
MEAMRDIQTKFTQTRNAEAEAMLSEMLEVDREAVIAEYNAAQDSKVTQVPQDNEKRTSRYMVPLFAWLAKTLGEPTPQDLFQFALQTGAISLK